MNKADREKLYRLLSQYYPKAKQLQSRESLTAYGLALERYRYEDVKAAVVSHAIRSGYFPKLSELLSGLEPELPGEADEKDRSAGYEKYLDLAEQKPRQLCRVLIAGRATGGTFGAMLERYAPAVCLDCPRRASCRDFQKLHGGV